MKRFLLVALLAGGCAQEAAEQTQSTPGEIEAPRPQDVTPSEPAAAAGGAATPDQAVQLIEYAIRMPQTLSAGKQGFHVENAGKELHSFVIEGNGVNSGLQSELSRGGSAHLEVNLPAGTYTVYCPVRDHRRRGMETTVTVR